MAQKRCRPKIPTLLFQFSKTHAHTSKLGFEVIHYDLMHIHMCCCAFFINSLSREEKIDIREKEK